MSQQWICTKCGKTKKMADKLKPRANDSTCSKASNKLHNWVKNGK